jgi:hypothetical protein
MECFGSIHVPTVGFDLRERIGNALPIFSGTV